MAKYLIDTVFQKVIAKQSNLLDKMITFMLSSYQKLIIFFIKILLLSIRFRYAYLYKKCTNFYILTAGNQRSDFHICRSRSHTHEFSQISIDTCAIVQILSDHLPNSLATKKVMTDVPEWLTYIFSKKTCSCICRYYIHTYIYKCYKIVVAL